MKLCVFDLIEYFTSHLIAPAGRPHLVKFYFSTGRPERRVYILLPDLHGVHSSNNLVHSSNNSTKLLLRGARKSISGTVGSQTRPPCSRCCWPSWPAQSCLRHHRRAGCSSGVTLGMVQAPRCACLPFAFLALIFLMPVLLPQPPKSLFFDLQTPELHVLLHTNGSLTSGGCWGWCWAKPW